MENLQQPHNQSQDQLQTIHLHHQARAHDGHNRGSEQESEKHKASPGESEPLVHHLKTSDWQEQALKHKAGAAREKNNLPSLELTEHDKFKQSLSNTKLSPADRLEAARHLIHDGVRSIKFKDEQGKEHDYHVQLFNSGKVRVTEGDQTVVQDAGLKAASPAPGAASAEAKTGEGTGTKAGEGTSAKFGEKTGKESQIVAHGPESVAGQKPNHQHGPAQLSERAGGHDRYQAHKGGQREGGKATGGSPVSQAGKTISIPFHHLACDGDGTTKVKNDLHYNSQTALQRSDGEYLNAKKDRYFVLNPEVAAKYGIKPGDLGRLVRKDTGQSVSVVFGDTTPSANRLLKHGRGEASLAALQALGFKNVNGNNSAPDGDYEIQFVAGSGNGTGDIARDPVAMDARLNRLNQLASAN